ncbi:MAG: carbohydrate kinase [Oscillospiraceae bacterium]|jgi:fructokinase|nr:carbohydrate kinase [Oscillospiraceae bacterium]
MTDVAALGELLIDFTPVPGAVPPAFTPNPGGAPANVLTAVVKLGGSGEFLGKVGDDRFGHLLKDTLDAQGVGSSGLLLDPRFHTTLAFVHLDEKGDRSFSFYRTQGADTQLTPEELPLALIAGCRIFHFGSLTLTDGPSRSATLKALDYARAQGKTISCDPNWRPLLWDSPARYVAELKPLLPLCHLVKASEEELALITGEQDTAAGAKALLALGVQVLVITMGPAGCTVFTGEGSRHLPTYDVKVVDTTGSGDAFWGAFLSRIAASGQAPAALSLDTLSAFADFANAAGSLCATRYGAIPAMPSAAEIQACQSTCNKLEL